MAAPIQSLGERTLLGGAVAALLALLGSLACNVHEPVAAFRSSVFIGDRGISVPLPPPSLTAEPKQDVEVAGELEDPDQITAGAVLRLVELNTDIEATIELEESAATFVAALELDLSRSCLEVWVELPDGRTSMPAQYSTRITSDDSVEVVAGCAE